MCALITSLKLIYVKHEKFDNAHFMKTRAISVFIIFVLLLMGCTNKVTEPTINYRLITNANPPEAGRISPSDTTIFEEGSKVTLEAIPNQHWLFDKWTEDLNGNENPSEILMDRSKTIFANFTKVQHLLIVNIEGEGIVEEQIVLSKTNDYDYGTIVQLTAIADSGWVFDSWTGDAIGNDNPLQILIDTNKTITANFIQTFILKIDITGNGSVQIVPDLSAYPMNSIVQLTAIADSGWVFDSWAGDVQDSSSVVNVQIDNDKTINVLFNVLFIGIILPQTTWKYFNGTQQIFSNEFGWLNPESLFVRVEADATPYHVSKLNYQTWQYGNWSNWQEMIISQNQFIAEFDIDISDYEGEGKVQFNVINNYNMLSNSTQINYKYDHTAPIFDITAEAPASQIGGIGLDWTINDISDNKSKLGYFIIYRDIDDAFLGAIELNKIPIVYQDVIPIYYWDDSMPKDDITTKYFYWGKIQDKAGNMSSEARLDNAVGGTNILIYTGGYVNYTFWDGVAPYSDSKIVTVNEFGWFNESQLKFHIAFDGNGQIIASVKWRVFKNGAWTSWATDAAGTITHKVDIDISGMSNIEGENIIEFYMLMESGIQDMSGVVHFKYDVTAPTFDITAGNASGGFGRIGLEWINNDVSDELSGIGYIIVYRNTSDSFSGAVEIGRINIISQSIISNSFIDESLLYNDQKKYFYWGKAQDKAGNLSSESRLDN